MKKQKRFSQRVIIFVCTSAVVFFVLAIGLGLLLRSMLDTEANRLICTAAEQSVRSAELMLENNINVLEIISAYGHGDPIAALEKSVERADSSFLKDTLLTSVGIVYLNNNTGFSTDGQIYSFVEKTEIERIQKGHTVVTYGLYNLISKKEYIQIAIPMRNESGIIGAVYGKLDCDKFSTHLNKYNTNSYYRYYLVDKSLNNALRTSDSEPRRIFDRVGDHAIVNDVTFHPTESEGVIYRSNDEMVHFTSLSVDDLQLMTIMDQSAVMSTSRQILSMAVIIIMIAAVAFIGILIIISELSRRSKRRVKESALELDTVMSNIMGGVVRFNYDEGYTIRFLNEGLLVTTGYTYKDLSAMLGNRFLNFLHTDDRQKLCNAVKCQCETGKSLQVDCRLIKKDGTYAWVLIKGRRFSQKDHHESCICVLTDISVMKEKEQELNQTMQRYSVVIEQSDSIIFEYSFLKHQLYFSDKWHEKFTFIPDQSHPLDAAIAKGFVHKDDAEKVRRVFGLIKNGTNYAYSDVRLKAKNDNYIWCTIKASAIFDENGLAYKTVGKIIDVNRQYSERDILRKKAELDPLTNVYNKGATQMLIDNFIQNDISGDTHALMILDIDNFKRINDSLGHLVGDSVIMDIAARTKQLLRSEDIFGRIGGDEFAVLLKSIGNTENTKSKARELCSAFKHTVCGEDTVIHTSGSIGIALFTGNGQSYNQLLSKADTVLYEAKRLGKDQFVIYSDSAF